MADMTLYGSPLPRDNQGESPFAVASVMDVKPKMAWQWGDLATSNDLL